MMYLDKFIAVVKCDGKILREQEDVVHLPFGSEYSLYLKNLCNRKALVKIEIDGREVTGGGLIVHPGGTVDLERFIDTADMNKGYKFKFIQKTKQIQEHRGDFVEDGIIRIEWWFEKEIEYYYTTYSPPRYNIRSGGTAKGICGSSASWAASGSNVGMNTNSVFTCSCNVDVADGRNIAEFDDTPKSDEGITVEGSDSNQKFVFGYIGDLELKSHVVVFKLKGITAENKPISKPFTVDAKVMCRTCGKSCKSSQKYCDGCGTRLIVV